MPVGYELQTHEFRMLIRVGTPQREKISPMLRLNHSLPYLSPRNPDYMRGGAGITKLLSQDSAFQITLENE
jgi:hypothetical protein